MLLSMLLQISLKYLLSYIQKENEMICLSFNLHYPAGLLIAYCDDGLRFGDDPGTRSASVSNTALLVYFFLRSRSMSNNPSIPIPVYLKEA